MSLNICSFLLDIQLFFLYFATKADFLSGRLLRFQEISGFEGSILARFCVFIVGERREHVLQKSNVFARGCLFIPYYFLHPNIRSAKPKGRATGRRKTARLGLHPFGMGEIGFSDYDPKISGFVPTLVPRRERQNSSCRV